jgi:hypothetical protein
VFRGLAHTIALLAAALLEASSARAGVLIAPTRLVLQDGERHGEFVLVNKGGTSERYRVSVVNRRMSAEGRIVEAPEAQPGERFADAMIRFSPREVVLPPDEPQAIRILVRRPGDLEAGEYRSHLLLMQVPDAPAAAPAPDPGPRRGISVPVTPIYGITVPIIVRNGRLHAEGALSDLSLRVEHDVPRLHVQIHRAGDRSLFGDLEVRHELPGEPTRVVGRARGVALYTPNQARPFALDLDFPEGRVPTTGVLRVEYRDAEAGASSLIAEGAVGLTP